MSLFCVHLFSAFFLAFFFSFCFSRKTIPEKDRGFSKDCVVHRAFDGTGNVFTVGEMRASPAS